jgi:hypothetical protein
MPHRNSGQIIAARSLCPGGEFSSNSWKKQLMQNKKKKKNKTKKQTKKKNTKDLCYSWKCSDR